MNDFNTAGSEYRTYRIDRGFKYTEYPKSITLGDTSPKTFSVTSVDGVIYEWTAPTGWSINGGGNSAERIGLNSVSIVPDFCTQSDGKVEVKLKKGGEISNPFVFPYSGVSNPALELNEVNIFQYEDAFFTLKNINTTAIQSISVTGDGVILSSNDIITFTKSGNITITVSILINGCNTPITFQTIANVKPHGFTIAGPSTLCNQATYTIANLTEGATVQWSVPEWAPASTSSSGILRVC